MHERADVRHGLVTEGVERKQRTGQRRISQPARQPMREPHDERGIRRVRQHVEQVQHERIVPAQERVENLPEDEADRAIVTVPACVRQERPDRPALHPAEMSGRVVVEKAEPQRRRVERKRHRCDDEHCDGEFSIADFGISPTSETRSGILRSGIWAWAAGRATALPTGT